MRIGILGGTGKEGAGLALRWAQAGHDIIIGSRDAERARAKSVELSGQAGRAIGGMSNRDAAASTDVVVLALPASGLAATLGELTDACRGKVVISTVVPLSFGGGRLFTPPAQGSSAEEAQALLGPEARVVAAFHHIAAHELSATGHDIECDLLLCGGDAEAKKAVAERLGGLGWARPGSAGADDDVVPRPGPAERESRPFFAGASKDAYAHAVLSI